MGDTDGERGHLNEMKIPRATLARLQAFASLTGLSHARIIDAALRRYFDRADIQEAERALATILGLEESAPTVETAPTPAASVSASPKSCACREPARAGVVHSADKCVAPPAAPGEVARPIKKPVSEKRRNAAKSMWARYTPEERVARVAKMHARRERMPETAPVQPASPSQ